MIGIRRARGAGGRRLRVGCPPCAAVLRSPTLALRHPAAIPPPARGRIPTRPREAARPLPVKPRNAAMRTRSVAEGVPPADPAANSLRRDRSPRRAQLFRGRFNKRRSVFSEYLAIKST